MFYTGNEQIIDGNIDLYTKKNVQIIRGRPDLPNLVSNIIFGLESNLSVQPQDEDPSQLMRHLKDAFEPWRKYHGAKEYVKSLDKKLVMNTWAMMYCGGSPALKKTLREIADDLGLDLHVESFNW